MTTGQMLEIKRRNLAGENDREIAEATGLHLKVVNKVRRQMGLQSVGRRGFEPGLYFVYLKKTDELEFCGTARECAEHLGIKLGSFRSLISRNKKAKRNRYEIIREGNDED